MLEDLRAWVALAAAGAQFIMRTTAGTVALLSRDPQRRANARALLGALDGQPDSGSGSGQPSGQIRENTQDGDQPARTNNPAEADDCGQV
ncbi:MAG: hypothetical protein V7603_5124 [Micromonosporaceae bacterium]